MGAKFSVKFANIYVYKLLEQFFLNHNYYKITLKGRLVGDIFLLWEDSEESFSIFFNTLNNYHTTIKFELHYSYTHINFLDTIVYKNKIFYFRNQVICQTNR